MLTREEVQKLAAQVLKYSSFPECQVNINSTEQCYTRFANNGITLASFSIRHTVSISSTRETKTGTAQTNDVDPAALKAAVKRSEELAEISPANPEHLPPVGKQEFSNVSDYDEATAHARSPEMIPSIKAIIDAAKDKELVAAGLFDRTFNVRAVANKAGLFGYHRSTDSQLSTTVRAPDGASSGWAGQPATRMSGIDAKLLAHTAIEKCLRWRGARRLDPGKYTVILEPTAAGDLISLMQPAFSARSAEEGRGTLSKRGGGTQLGEKLFPDFVTLYSDPFDGRLPSSPWNGDLLPAKKVTWVEKGVVKALNYDRYWANKTGKAPTQAPGGGGGGRFGGGGGGGGRGGDFLMNGGDATTEELIKTVEKGLLVTHFWYIRFVNQQTLQHTGLTRDGLFLIEDGKITAPVVNFRFNESPMRLLKNTVRLGQARRIRGLEGATMIAPTIVATDFPFTSVSDAV
ncbi:MAG: TldD/PmbA family protein [Bryobacteraceae bacterium]